MMIKKLKIKYDYAKNGTKTNDNNLKKVWKNVA